MSEHAWVRDQIATYLAGGLDAGERSRLEHHALDCRECGGDVEEAKALEARLQELFEPVRADVTLEDRVIRAVRMAGPARRSAPGAFSMVRRMIGVAAAVILLACIGVVLQGVEEGGPMAQREASPAYAPGLAAPANGYVGGEDDVVMTLSRDPAPPPATAADLARRYQQEDLRRLAEEDRRGRVGGWSSGPTGGAMPGETADDEEYSKSKFADMDGRFNGKKLEEYFKELQKSQGNYQSLYSFRNDGPAAKPAPSPDWYRPGDEMDHNESEERPADPATRKDTDPAKTPPRAEAKRGEKQEQDPPSQGRKIIRNGELEYEVDSFESALATIIKLATEEGGYVATTNSEKLANGKIRGEVIVRCPPDRLETLVLKLTALGELKSRRITSLDVTKQYTDIESRLRAARTMETRLLEIIKSGKGEIKDLLAAEKELGEWRQKIEVLEGEIRYLAAQVSMSTLTIQLTERNIRTAATATETEQVSMGLETDDVERAHLAAQTAIAEAKGRITRSELKRHDGGQLNSIIHFEVAADASGPLRDRLKQLGRVARLDVQRRMTTDGQGTPTGEIKKADSVYQLSIYNLIQIQPRQTVDASLACIDVEKSFRDVTARVEKAGGRIITSQLNRQRNDQTTATLHVDVPAAEADAVALDVRAAGEVMRFTILENPDRINTTDAKRGFRVQFWALGTVAPRETATLQLATSDVPSSYTSMHEAVQKAKGRILNAHLNEQDRQNVTGYLDFEVLRTEEAGVQAAMTAAGQIITRTVQRAQDADTVVDSKVRMQLTLLNTATIPPRERWTLGIEVSDVDDASARVAALGRVIQQNLSRTPAGQVVSRIQLQVPLSAAAEKLLVLRGLGVVRAEQAGRDPSVPEGEFTVAAFDVTLSNAELIIPRDSGFGAQIRKGLSTGFGWLLTSLMVITIGVLFVGPWALVGWGAYALVRRIRARQTATASSDAS